MFKNIFKFKKEVAVSPTEPVEIKKDCAFGRGGRGLSCVKKWILK